MRLNLFTLDYGSRLIIYNENGAYCSGGLDRALSRVGTRRKLTKNYQFILVCIIY